MRWWSGLTIYGQRNMVRLKDTIILSIGYQNENCTERIFICNRPNLILQWRIQDFWMGGGGSLDRGASLERGRQVRWHLWAELKK